MPNLVWECDLALRLLHLATPPAPGAVALHPAVAKLAGPARVHLTGGPPGLAEPGNGSPDAGVREPSTGEAGWDKLGRGRTVQTDQDEVVAPIGLEN